MTETLTLAGRLLQETLEPVGDPLPTSARNRVVRARRTGGSTVIVKHYLADEDEGHWRELSALKAFAGYDAVCRS